MRVLNGNVVIEQKGLYAIENYILSRRLMYMQVYLHKTVLSADSLLKKIFQRVQFLLDAGKAVEMPSHPLQFFLENRPTSKKRISEEMLKYYTRLDDHDVFISIKSWQYSTDKILADLSTRFLNRSLFRTTFIEKKESDSVMEKLHKRTKTYLKKRGFPHDDQSVRFYYDLDESYSEAYKYENESIWILDPNGKAVEFSKAADTKHIIALTKPVVKPYSVHLKELRVS